MKTGFICASGFNLVASATRNGKRLIAVVLGAPSSPYRAAKAAGLLERGFHRGALSWLSPSLGTVETLKPVNAAPPDLRDEMCGPHRKRPAAEEADDDAPEQGMVSNLPPSTEKPSSLIKDRPAAVKAIVVFAGAAKKAAEGQFAAARAKLSKTAKGKRGAVPAAAAAVADTAAGALQTPSSPPAGAFAPPPARTTRTLPAATDIGNPAMSYAPSAKPGPAPLTAMPEASAAAKKPQTAKASANAKTAPSAAKTPAHPAPAKSKKDGKSASKDTAKDGSKNNGSKSGTKSAATTSSAPKAQ
jgi:D-alanyl-D-alanine carboxypeptidase